MNDPIELVRRAFNAMPRLDPRAPEDPEVLAAAEFARNAVAALGAAVELVNACARRDRLDAGLEEVNEEIAAAETALRLLNAELRSAPPAESLPDPRGENPEPEFAPYRDAICDECRIFGGVHTSWCSRSTRS